MKLKKTMLTLAMAATVATSAVAMPVAYAANPTTAITATTADTKQNKDTATNKVWVVDKEAYDEDYIAPDGYTRNEWIKCETCQQYFYYNPDGDNYYTDNGDHFYGGHIDPHTGETCTLKYIPTFSEENYKVHHDAVGHYEEIQVDQNTLTMQIGETATLKATITPEAETNTVKWSSDNTAVASVDDHGVVTAASEGTATITATSPNGAVVTVAVTVTEKKFQSKFTDVPADAYYADSVKWAEQNGVAAGTSETTFSPDQTCTRGQIATFMYRAYGNKVVVEDKTPFTDVADDAYYANAVKWAFKNGVTAGTSATTFSPDDSCTRAQVVQFLWNEAGNPEPKNVKTAFTDVPEDAWYAKAVAWAAENDITAGTSETTFSPDQTCTRAQIVTLLCNQFKG